MSFPESSSNPSEAALISPSLYESCIIPAFSPAMPPILRFPVSSARFKHPSITPVSSLIPAIPPRFSKASPLPAKVQFWMVPLLVPAIPPIFFLLPSGFNSPCTFRFRTTASSSRYRNSPWLDPDCQIEMPPIVWSFPSKVPQNTGIGENSFPSKFKSASRLTVFPSEFCSAAYTLLSSRNSSSVRITITDSSACAENEDTGIDVTRTAAAIIHAAFLVLHLMVSTSFNFWCLIFGIGILRPAFVF